MTNIIPMDQDNLIKIPVSNIILSGNLFIPTNASGLVIFVHGSGSSRLSPRNRYVATTLNQEGLATLLFDLLTREEDMVDSETAEYRFNIPLLTMRLIGVTDWLQQKSECKALKFGYFGASTGAAAALMAAAKRHDKVSAVVSRGGRPDLAAEALNQVKAPSLLIVGGLDFQVITLNREAQANMHARTQLEIIPGATHLFEEPGALDQVTNLAAEWFKYYLVKKK